MSTAPAAAPVAEFSASAAVAATGRVIQSSRIRYVPVDYARDHGIAAAPSRQRMSLNRDPRDARARVPQLISPSEGAEYLPSGRSSMVEVSTVNER